MTCNDLRARHNDQMTKGNRNKMQTRGVIGRNSPKQQSSDEKGKIPQKDWVQQGIPTTF